MAAKTAQFANINYDVVYVRCPRGKEPVVRNGTANLLNWNGVNDLWLSAENNTYQEPGCDLVLHHSDMTSGDPSAEEVLVNCSEDDPTQPVCSVTDPNVSFDGRYVVFTKFTDTRNFVQDMGIRDITGVGAQSFMTLYPDGSGENGSFARNLFGGLKPFAAPAFIYLYDLQTGTEVKVSPDNQFFAGRAYPGKDPEWVGNVPVMDTGPYFLPDGRIGFTSNRNHGFGQFQLFAMDRDGSNMTVLSHRAMTNQLHPFILKDGRIVYTNFDGAILQRAGNNNFSLFSANPDGSDPFIFAGKMDSTEWSYHFATQLSDGDVVVTLYYNGQQTGLGSFDRFPAEPPGPDFVHRRRSGNLLSSEFTTLDSWASGISLVPFARQGQFRLTPQAGPGDTQMGLYSSSADYWVHPVDGRTVKMMGRFTHPAAAPDNDLLATYAIGGDSTSNSNVFRQSLAATMEQIGKDAGIWLVPLEPNSTREIGHIADDARIVVDFPQYHEIMARAVVSYQDIYGIPRPDPSNLRAATSNDGSKDPRLPAGAPYGLSGAASMYDRETRAFNGTPWNMQDGGGTMSGRTYTNLGTSGAELAIFDNSEIYGIRVLMPAPNIPKDLYTRTERWAGIQNHHLRILGEFPVRKPDASGNEPQDGQGNDDTSFVVRLPADTPFMFQTLDKRGMALDIETSPRSVTRGEQQMCAGCHVHTREGLDPFQSVAKGDSSLFGDFTGDSALLFAGNDGNGYPTVQTARQIYAGVPGVNARRSFAVDWVNGIKDALQNRCASCHGKDQSAQQLTGLRLDGTDLTYDLLTKNRYTREDGVQINSATKPGDGLTDIDQAGTDRITPHYDCCTPSRWLSVNSARSSMLVWALYGERLDGRDPATGLPPASSGVLVDGRGYEHPEIWPKVAEHAAYVAAMPESEKRLIARWIDMGAPKFNTHDDMMRPVLTVTPVGGSDTVTSVLVGLWDDSPLDFSRFRVTSNGTDDITPTVSGTPAIVSVTLPVTITDANADSYEFIFEIWDKPDRSLSYVSPGVSAANRSRLVYTGTQLLRMAGTPANSAPSSTQATITTLVDQVSAGVVPTVFDVDVQDSHVFSIVSQPTHGSAAVVNGRLVYTPASGFVGQDSFIFRASDLGGLSVNGMASVTVNPVVVQLEITGQPAPNTVTEGQTATFTVTASGGSNLTYQWRKNGSNIASANSASYTTPATTLADNLAVFSCVVSNGAGSLTSDGAVLTVNPNPVLAISGQPASKTVTEGQTATFMVTATGGSNLTYQWRKDGANITGANSASYTTLATVLGDNGVVFDCVVSNGTSSVTSVGAVLTVNAMQLPPPPTGTTLSDDFQDQTATGWTAQTASRWSVVQDGGSYAYSLNTSSYDPQSGDRLGEYALLPGAYGDFELSLQARLGDSIASNPQADYAVVFGYQDADNYYYMMFNADMAYTQLYKVVNGSRVVVASAASDWLNDEAYHSIGVTRSGNAISVTFDGATVVSATDSSFGAGQVGVGSFNDAAYFDDIQLVASNAGTGGTGGTGDTGGGNSGGGGATGPLLLLVLVPLIYARRRRITA